ncbi:MAG: putative peptidoglycan glycosyltransferase FtsW [Patescibacteria group bacterium]
MLTWGRKITGRYYFFFILIVVLIGFFVFSSAALGLLNRTGASYGRIVFNQFTLLLFSLAAMTFFANLDYRRLRRFALPAFLIALGLSLLVFVPGLGFASGGAHRWISLGSRTFQPSELLKLAFIIYLAAWLSRPNSDLPSWRSGLLPFLLLIGVTGASLIAEPDLGTFAILLAAAIGMFFVAGGRWVHLGVVFLLGASIFTVIILSKPYALDRVLTFINPDEKALTDSYQIKQSLIAIGSGGILGRGFGHSLQKFYHLPEPIGDSIFAVLGEEFGLLGGLTIIAIFIIFALWGFSIARHTTDRFGQLLVTGIVVLIATGAFVNIASMLGVFPLTGIPLTFVSHGGSSLLFSLIGCGIILNVAKREKKSN